MKAMVKQLFKDSFMYGIGDVVSKAILFLLLPVYTRIFTPGEYGAIETFVILNNFLSVFLVMGMDAGQSFFFFEQKVLGKDTQKKVVSAIFQWRLIWGSVLVVIATVLAPVLNTVLFKGQLSLKYFVIAFIGNLLVHFMNQSAEVFRLLYKPLQFISITAGNTLAASLISIILVVRFGWGIIGYFTGICIGALIAAIIGWSLIWDYLDLSVLHREWWSKLVIFGFPIFLSTLAMYVLQNADRWFIISYCGLDTLGTYAVGAKFVIFILILVNAFRQAWLPISMEALHEQYGRELFYNVARLYFGTGMFCVVVITFVSPFLVKIFSGSAYHSAYPIVGILAWYAVFYGFFQIVSGGILKEKRTIWLTVSSVTAGIINIILNLILVPKYGGIGAAISTSVSFLVWNLVSLIVSEGLWPVHYPFGIFALQFVLGIIGSTGILFLYRVNASIWFVGIFTFCISVLLVLTIVNHRRFTEIISCVRT